MKICAVISEYNPFHNGHLYQLGEIKKRSGCDAVLCIMSGNFTQRGEAAVLGKYTRARHAVLAGADAVLELPAAFACCAAEIFAQGALNILDGIPAVTTLAFGCESGTKESFLAAARALSREDKAFKTALKENMKEGASYAHARTLTALSLHSELDEALLRSPNNLLGVEYCRAILALGSSIEPLPILRVGGGHGEEELLQNYSSASALRAALGSGRKAQKLLKSNLPKAVLGDLTPYAPVPYEKAALLALLGADEADIAETPDCAEGLENRLKAFARSTCDYNALIRKATTKRYTASRLRRILLQNFLGITLKEVRGYLASPLYCRTLALKKERAEELLRELARGKFPVISRKSDVYLLKKDALACFEKDVHANDCYNALTGIHTGEYETLFV